MPTKPSIATRERIVKAASRVFAQNGYEGASIRKIVAAADVNQAAINYHFGGKEGLYRAILQTALAALMPDQLDRQEPGTISREDALRRFVRQQLRPMTARDELSHYIRIFSWETLRPSPAFRGFMAQDAAPVLAAAIDLVRRFLPLGATDKQAALGAFWLFGQCSIFVRNSEQLANPPLRLKVDDRLVEELSQMISTWAAAGLARPIGPE